MTKIIILLCVMLTAFTLVTAVPRDYVVVEVGTGTWCQYCPGAAMGVDDLVSNGKRVAVIEYHNGDTFTNAFSNTRNSYYNITGYPTAFFDGGLSLVGGDHNVSLYDSYLPKYNTRIAINSAFTIALSGTLEGDMYRVTATINKVEASSATNLYLRAALTESDITFTWQGQSHLNFVERDMYPNATGTAVNFAVENTQVVTFEFLINSAWVVGNCELVVFLQNNSTKEILQGTKVKIAGLINAFPLNTANINFGDVVVNASGTTELIINNYWNQTMTGTIQSSDPQFQLTFPGRETFEIPAFGQEIYQVTCIPQIAGNITGDIIITSNIPAYPEITVPMTANGFIDNAPTVSNLTITGVPVVYQILTSDYIFTDIDGDAEGISLFQWYRLEGEVLSPISGQTQRTYTLQPEDIGKQIKFSVTPYDEHGIPSPTVMSPASEVIEVLPSPQNLTASVANGIDVTLNWLAPNHFGRGLFGYKVYRDGVSIATLPNPATLTFSEQLLINGTHTYYVVAIFNNPLTLSDPSNTVSVEISGSAIDDNTNAVVSTQLYPAYPNPFNAVSGRTNIRYNLVSKADVDVSIYDIRGRKVMTLIHETKNAGDYTVDWNGRNDQGALLASGVYHCRMISGNHVETKKIVLIK